MWKISWNPLCVMIIFISKLLLAGLEGNYFYDVPFIFEGILRKSACLNFVLTALSSVADARAYGKRRPALKVGSEDEYHIMALENISPLRRVFRLN